MMLKTPLCDVLNIEVPIIAAPMGPDLTTVELAAAVSNAGGIGIISFGAYPPPLLREQIKKLRHLTNRPFGVNFILYFPVAEAVDVCLEEEVPLLSFTWGDPSQYVAKAHSAGSLVMHQIGSVKHAIYAAKAGVDIIVAQGQEAGGHVEGEISGNVLIPAIVDAIGPLPVVAAGGIADGRGLVAALALGAAGVMIGTRFLATPESGAHPLYKERIVKATEQDTVRTTLFGGGWPDAPHRTLKTPFVEQWLPQEKRGSEQRADEPVIGERPFGGQTIPVTRFASLPPSAETTGEIESMALVAGQTVGLVNEIKPAAQIVREIIEEARRIVEERLPSMLR